MKKDTEHFHVAQMKDFEQAQLDKGGNHSPL
jgi:hypothetical protein